MILLSTTKDDIEVHSYISLDLPREHIQVVVIVGEFGGRGGGVVFGAFTLTEIIFFVLLTHTLVLEVSLEPLESVIVVVII